jgi:peptidoglycan/xylan/chitin deacetylase (PgdA/CDA1 family)
MMGEARVPVLMYHRVGEACNAWEARYAIDPSAFASHMHALARKHYRAVGIDAVVDWLEGRRELPQGSFLLTFDDGFVGVHDHAWPVLKELGWPFAVFLVAGLIGGSDEWTRTANPSGITYPLMNIGHIRAMQQDGVGFHSHTISHPSLPRVADTRLREELADSRRILSDLLESEVAYLAYPYGHLDERVEAAARAAGYRAAFSTQPGFNRRGVNPFRIRRLDVYGTDTPAMLLRKIHLGCNDGSLSNRLRYYLSRAWARLAVADR